MSSLPEEKSDSSTYWINTSMASKAHVLFPVRVTCSYSNNAMFCKIIPAGFMPVGIMSVGPSLILYSMQLGRKKVGPYGKNFHLV